MNNDQRVRLRQLREKSRLTDEECREFIQLEDLEEGIDTGEPGSDTSEVEDNIVREDYEPDELSFTDFDQFHSGAIGANDARNATAGHQYQFLAERTTTDAPEETVVVGDSRPSASASFAQLHDTGTIDNEFSIREMDDDSMFSILNRPDDIPHRTNAAASSCKLSSPAGMEWDTVPPRSLRTLQANILRVAQGAVEAARNFQGTIVQLISLILTAELIGELVSYTNDKAKAYFDSIDKAGTYDNVDAIELRAFLGVLVLMGVFRSQREPVRELWSTNSAFHRAVFFATMSRERFKEIKRFLRFDDWETREIRRSTDKLAALRSVCDTIASKFRELYNPSDTVTVDEQLVRFFGRCPFKVYMPSKPDKYGIKLWVAADASNQYCLNFQVYCGKLPDEEREVNQGCRVVHDLVDYLGSGYNITTDNFFTSVTLARELLVNQNSKTLVGTLRKNKREIPADLLRTTGRTPGSCSFCFNEQFTMVAYVPKRNKVVLLLSTMHHDTVEVGVGEEAKPEIVMYYNSTKGGVDSLDEKVKAYRSYRRSARWPLCLFCNMLDLTLYNSYILYTLSNSEWNANKTDRRRLFSVEAGMQLVLPHIRRRQTVGLTRPIVTCIEAVLNSVDETLYRQRDRVDVSTLMSRKRCRCDFCPARLSRLTSNRCSKCAKFVCNDHSEKSTTYVCLRCTVSRDAESAPEDSPSSS